MHVLAGAGSVSWTDPTITAGVTLIRRVHLTELRSFLDEARSTLSLPAVVYTDPTITAGSTTIKAQHILDLRSGLQ